MSRPRRLQPRPALPASTLWGLPGLEVVAQRAMPRKSAGVELMCDTLDDRREWPVRAVSERQWHDLPHLGQPTRLRIRCFRRDGPDGQRSHQRAPGLIEAPWLMTERLAVYAQLRCLERPLAEIERQIGVPRRKLRRLLQRLEATFDAAYRPTAAHALGLDGVHLDGQTWTQIADVEGNCLIELLPSHTTEDIAAAFGKFERRDLVRLVAMDASALERRAVALAFPTEQRVVVVLDRRHAIALVLKALAQLRKSLGFAQQRLSPTAGRRKVDRLKSLLEKAGRKLTDDQRAWLASQLANRPEGARLLAAYTAKETFLELWEAGAQAPAAFAAWRRGLAHAGIADVYQTAVVTLGHDWRAEFLAGLAHPGLGTGFIEALNRQLKQVHAATRGNSAFGLLRLRLLYAHGRPETRALIADCAAAVARSLALAPRGEAV